MRGVLCINAALVRLSMCHGMPSVFTSHLCCSNMCACHASFPFEQDLFEFVMPLVLFFVLKDFKFYIVLLSNIVTYK